MLTLWIDFKAIIKNIPPTTKDLESCKQDSQITDYIFDIYFKLLSGIYPTKEIKLINYDNEKELKAIDEHQKSKLLSSSRYFIFLLKNPDSATVGGRPHRSLLAVEKQADGLRLVHYDSRPSANSDVAQHVAESLRLIDPAKSPLIKTPCG